MRHSACNHITPLYAAFAAENSKLWMVMSYMDRGSMGEQLRLMQLNRLLLVPKPNHVISEIPNHQPKIASWLVSRPDTIHFAKAKP
jgi:serine/threonine protein kinase